MLDSQSMHSTSSDKLSGERDILKIYDFTPSSWSEWIWPLSELQKKGTSVNCILLLLSNPNTFFPLYCWGENARHQSKVLSRNQCLKLWLYTFPNIQYISSWSKKTPKFVTEVIA